MILLINPVLAEEAAAYLSEQDEALAVVIATAGLCPVRPHKNYYQELVDSIVSQQLSVKAAATIFKRFLAIFDDAFPSPEAILEKSVEEFRAAGLSYAKGRYVQDLAQHIIDGKIKFDHFDTLSNEEIIKELTAVKGIGEWTVHMFLIFCMGRTDVLATGDLGIRNGIQKLYDLPAVPTPQQVVDIAQKYHWHPYESIACWYIWQSLKNTPEL